MISSTKALHASVIVFALGGIAIAPSVFANGGGMSGGGGMYRR